MLDAMADDRFVSIDRNTKWGNPFLIGKDGTRQVVVEKYKKRIKKNATLLSRLPQLKGKVLGCWCVEKPIDYIRDNKRCHGEVLLELLFNMEVEKL